jgi:uncharacterized membrane protein YgdD (TMEM256/DUF423 family)
MNRLMFAAALSAAIAIAASAFGAHGATEQAAKWLTTGGFYQLTHAVAAVALMNVARKPAALLLLGSTIFAVTLYLMALGMPRWLGAVTPIGGVIMISGWLWIAYLAAQKRIGS